MVRPLFEAIHGIQHPWKPTNMYVRFIAPGKIEDPPAHNAHKAATALLCSTIQERDRPRVRSPERASKVLGPISRHHFVTNFTDDVQRIARLPSVAARWHPPGTVQRALYIKTVPCGE